jgi:hypothetical protein
MKKLKYLFSFQQNTAKAPTEPQRLYDNGDYYYDYYQTTHV